MSGEDLTVVLKVVAPLDKGEDKVANLRNDGNNESENCKYPVRGKILVEVAENESVYCAADNAEYNAADSSLNSFLGAD